jgi:hypothetical protein
MLTDRLYDRIGYDPQHPCCWSWVGATDSSGYGHLRVKGKLITAHRLAHQLWIGPLVEGLEVDHLCANRRCFNPLHLEQVPRSVNKARGKVNGHKGKTHCTNGHEFTPENTYLNPQRNGDMRRQCKTCIFDRTRRRRARLTSGTPLSP